MVIDVSQSVEPTHAQAFHFLHRDCRNITRFFKKSNVPDIMTDEELFTHVCGRSLGTSNCLDDLENECKENFEGNEEMLTFGLDSKNFAFDYHFKQSEKMKKEEEEEEEDEEEQEEQEDNVKDVEDVEGEGRST